MFSKIKENYVNLHSVSKSRLLCTVMGSAGQLQKEVTVIFCLKWKSRKMYQIILLMLSNSITSACSNSGIFEQFSIMGYSVIFVILLTFEVSMLSFREKVCLSYSCVCAQRTRLCITIIIYLQHCVLDPFRPFSVVVFVCVYFHELS